MKPSVVKLLGNTWMGWSTPLLLVLVTLLAACGPVKPDRQAVKSLPMLTTDGTQWVSEQGEPVALRGTNLGNWLLQEFWMMAQPHREIGDQCTLEAELDKRFGFDERERLMKILRDSWITERDWDLLADFGLNLIRVPFNYNLIEDEREPFSLRADAWQYLDDALQQAEARKMYVILDLHGAAGAQGWEHHSGCGGRNWYWDGGDGRPASYYQERTIWLWEQIAERYKDRSVVAAYGLLNEPWGTDPETLADVMTELYHAVRAVDPGRTMILPGHNEGFAAYGDPAQRGMSNVAIDMHPYPGFFGWGEPSLEVHRDWLTCVEGGHHHLCAWLEQLEQIDTAFLVGEFQPWAGLGVDLGGQVARVTYDTYIELGWATTSWAYKVLTTSGGQGDGVWGMVTNKQPLPAIEFSTATKREIEERFRLFATLEYDVHQGLMHWLNADKAPVLFPPAQLGPMP